MADIPKLGTQWKIIYELNSTECLQSGDPAKGTLGLGVIAGDPIHSGIFMGFLPPNVRLVHGIYEGPNSIQATPFLESSQLPEVREWTGIEISHEEVESKYFLSWSVGGREVGREEAGPDLKKLTDVRIGVGDPATMPNMPGFVRKLVVLEKR